jgi:hypothetical protein
MMHQSLIQLIRNLKKQSSAILIAFISLMVMIPSVGMSQPGAPGGGGGNPDSPLPPSVPFDWKLNIAFLITGLLFAIVVLKKLQRKQSVN